MKFKAKQIESLSENKIIQNVFLKDGFIDQKHRRIVQVCFVNRFCGENSNPGFKTLHSFHQISHSHNNPIQKTIKFGDHKSPNKL